MNTRRYQYQGPIRGREVLNAWVSGIHAVLPDLTFVLDVAPITDDEHLVVRWNARGTYWGGFPGASPEAVGRTITFTGTDTLRITDGRLAEYWANADSLLFLQQLGVREVPARGEPRTSQPGAIRRPYTTTENVNPNRRSIAAFAVLRFRVHVMQRQTKPSVSVGLAAEAVPGTARLKQTGTAQWGTPDDCERAPLPRSHSPRLSPGFWPGSP